MPLSGIAFFFVTRLGLEPRTLLEITYLSCPSRYQAVSISCLLHFLVVLCGFCAGALVQNPFHLRKIAHGHIGMLRPDAFDFLKG